MWDRDSRAEHDRAKNQLFQSGWSVDYAERQLGSAEWDASRTNRQWFLIPSLFFTAGVFGTIWYITRIPYATTDTGGNWAVGFLAITVIVILMSAAAILDNRSERDHALDEVVRCQQNLVDAKENESERRDNLAAVAAQANEKEAQNARFANLQDRLLEIGSYVETAHEQISSTADPDVEAEWAKLAAERGWPEHLTKLIRGAEEAVGLGERARTV